MRFIAIVTSVFTASAAAAAVATTGTTAKSQELKARKYACPSSCTDWTCCEDAAALYPYCSTPSGCV